MPLAKRAISCAAASLLALAVPLAGGSSAANGGFEGRWLLTVTIPDSPGSRGSRVFTLSLNASPRGDSLNGRVTITDAENRTVPGSWRQAGKRISIAYEAPCPWIGTSPCASLVLLGKLKVANTRLKKGRVIVMWDTANDQDPSFYDTSAGTFIGERLP